MAADNPFTGGQKASFPTSDDGLRQATEWCDGLCSSPRVAVVVDEIFSNIVRCSGSKAFSVQLARENGELKLTVSDDGTPFDPLTAPEPDITASAEERQIGGLGLFMVKKMSKSLAYARRDGRNVLELVINE